MFDFLRNIFKVPEDLLILSKLVTKLLLFIFDSLVKVRNEVIEVILPLEMSLSHLMSIHWGHNLIISSQLFPGICSLTLEFNLGPLVMLPFLSDRAGFRDEALMCSSGMR